MGIPDNPPSFPEKKVLMKFDLSKGKVWLPSVDPSGWYMT